MESDCPEDLDAENTSRSTQNPDDFVVMDSRQFAVIPWDEFTVKFKDVPVTYDSVAEICE